MSEKSKVECRDIIWDTEQEDGSRPTAEALGLPAETVIEVDMNGTLDDEAKGDAVLDALSAAYGYAVFYSNFEVGSERYLVCR